MAKLIPAPSADKFFLIFCQHGMPRGGVLQNLIRLLLNCLKPGFSHVKILQKTPLGAWVVIDSCNDGLSVSVEVDPYLLAKAKANPAFTVVETWPVASGVQLRGFITCVSIAKYLLGISKPLIITPYQLYKYVSKQGKD